MRPKLKKLTIRDLDDASLDGVNGGQVTCNCPSATCDPGCQFSMQPPMTCSSSCGCCTTEGSCPPSSGISYCTGTGWCCNS